MMTNFSHAITKCQICQNPDLQSVLFLGYVPPVNQMEAIGATPKEELMFPLGMLYCSKCHLVQIGLKVNADILFPPSYPYTSGTTKILRENFANLHEECRRLKLIDDTSFCIDVGSNDGTLLANFHESGCRVLGIEPTDQGDLANSRGIKTHKAFFSQKTAAEVAAKHGQAQLMTAANVFAHIWDVDDVVSGVKTLLEPNGVFISENHYLLPLIETLQYDTIYHEHLRYYSLHALQNLFGKHDMEIFHVQRIPTHGGSVRVFSARKGQRSVMDSVAQLLDQEKAAGLLDAETYKKFAVDVAQSKLDLMAMVRDIKKQGQSVYGIAAPSRASTLITYTGLDHETLSCVLEISGSHKIGKYMPGTLIPVLNEDKLFEDQPEYALMLAWHIADEIMPKLKKKGFKGQFIVPLPQPRIVNLDA
jgi:hypothetical protein